MRRPLVAGNWKMNATTAMASLLAAAVADAAPRRTDVVLCPPFPYLTLVGERLAASPVVLGAQDLASERPGAFTGEVAGEMLVDVGCRYVIVGHSERRARNGEDDALVAAKFARALECGLTPIACVGESLDEREAGRTLEVVLRQLDVLLAARGAEAVDGAVIAYEPIWAIGTGRTATPELAEEVHAGLRARLAAAGAPAEDIRLLYGGSVKPGNAAELFAMPNIDGGLIGGAALEADDFLAICEAA